MLSRVGRMRTTVLTVVVILSMRQELKTPCPYLSPTMNSVLCDQLVITLYVEMGRGNVFVGARY